MSEGKSKRVVRQYPVEFKIDAVEPVEKKGYGMIEAARSLGIAESNIHKWRRQYREGRLVLGHKRAQRQGGLPVTQPTTDEAELKRLRAEVKRLETELAIVKKAAVYFAKHTT